MKIKSENEFAKEIETLKLEPVYILTGCDTERKKEIINKLKNRIKSDFDWIEHNPSEQSIELLISDLMTPPLFSARRIIIINNFEKIKSIKNDITEYFKKPVPSTVLFIMYNEDLKDNEIKKMYEGFEISVVPFFELSEDEIRNTLNHFFESRKLKLSPQSISLISNSIINYSHLNREIEKLDIYLYGKKDITENELSALITSFKEADIFEISDAILSNNRHRFKQTISNLIESSREPLEIIAAIEYILEKIIKVKTLYKKFSQPPYELLSILSITKYDLYRIKPYIAEIFPDEKIIAALEMCLEAENTLKSSLTQDGYVVVRNISFFISENLMSS